MKKNIFILLAAFSFSSILSGQTKEIYTHPDSDSLTRDHQVIAILPFEVMIRLRPKQMKKLEPEDLEKLEMAEGQAIQKALHTYFLKEKDSCKVSFQDISKTNELLAAAGWTEDSLRLKGKASICRKLQVDGMITGTVTTSKPMSDEAAAALHALDIVVAVVSLGTVWGGVGAPTNSGNCIIKLYEGKSGELIWKYERTLSRGLGSDTQSVINAMMRKASKKFPYEVIK